MGNSDSDKEMEKQFEENHDKDLVNFSPPDSPFCGFLNADIPQPIVIKTELFDPEGSDDDDCVVVDVRKAEKPLPPTMVKKEIEDDDDVEFFYGFQQSEIPRPIVIKAEPEDEDVSVERSLDESVTNVVNVPGDDLIDEFETDLFIVDKDASTPSFVLVQQHPEGQATESQPYLFVPRSQEKSFEQMSPRQNQLDGPVAVMESEERREIAEEAMDVIEQEHEHLSTSELAIQAEQQALSHQRIYLKDDESSELKVLNTDHGEDRRRSLGEKMRIIETDGDEDGEDREYTVIVEDADDITDHEDGTVIEADSIEDILAQFENESSPESVNCPNCRKCFVSAHFLNLHISNASTMCDLCNTQCCSAVNLRNHKNLECDLSKRRRNIDLIAQETVLMGRKHISPEKYYDIRTEDEEAEEGTPPPVVKKFGSDVKYECGVCGKHVKILDSHMKFIHGMDGGAKSNKYKCPQCGLLVINLQRHMVRIHGPDAEEKEEIEDDCDDDVIRCRQPGCELFFNTSEEVLEHQKREHTEEVRLACGMGGCDEVFDNRGALKRHRNDVHPELDEFKPVDLEPDDADRAQDMTVACPVCERKFKHKNTCTIHIKTNHLGWTKRKLFECPDCFHMFENKKEVERHREAVHLGIRTVCPLCDKPVTRLDLHVRMVHTDMPEWPCPDCGKKFKRKFDLNRHRVTVHLGVRNFPCDLCGKRFADMKDMTRHKNAVHYGMKIRWNTNKNKQKHNSEKPKVGARKSVNKANSLASQEVKLEEGTVTIPVEYIETVETSDQMHVAASLEGSTVILDPVLQSQLASVQGGPGEPRVLIEPDPDNSGGLRFVVIQEEGEDLQG